MKRSSMGVSRKKVSVFGLGYVGSVTAGCLASKGFEVIGVDVDEIKTHMINTGQTPVIEDELSDYIADSVKQGNLSGMRDAPEAVRQSDYMIVCVGTPSRENGRIQLDYVERVSAQIGQALKDKDGFPVVIYRSTVIPGTVQEKMVPILEEYSGKKAGVDFGVCFNPEFLREGSAVYDFFNPCKIVVGSMDVRTRKRMEDFYSFIDMPVISVDIKTSEIVKYADNLFHAVKVTFGNEIGMVCKALDIDSRLVMEIFCQDTKLNLSPYYLKPGLPFGGSCLPKDLRAFMGIARSCDMEIPLITSIMNSNDKQVKNIVRKILRYEKKKVAFLGLSFKAGTDDLRESPLVDLIEILLGKGLEIKIYDPNVSLACLTGANKEFILKKISHISNLLTDDADEIIDFADIVIVAHKT
ncbi:MAG: nucleotide sugar dehydrogenase, partial [Anaerohalosphaera sp.]|nr:nucleotide sugar dehydrogenase [Anaerohalosphaera sp.]